MQVFPIGSPLVADVSRAILKVEESNKANQLESAWFKKIDESCPDPLTSPDPNPSESFRKLGIDSFLGFVCCCSHSLCYCTGEMHVSFLEGEPRPKKPERIVGKVPSARHEVIHKPSEEMSMLHK